MYGRETAKTLPDRRGLLTGVVAGLTVAAVAADAGGFDATTWGWCAIALLLVAATSLVLGGRRLSALEWALPAVLAPSDKVLRKG